MKNNKNTDNQKLSMYKQADNQKSSTDKKKNNPIVFLKDQKNNKYISYTLIVLLGILLCIPLFTMNLNEYNEFRIHIGRVVYVKEILKNGIFPPFISHKNMLTFGYALNIFYGVLTTYIPILISLITGSSIMAIKIFTVLTVIFSGITMYIFVKKITKNEIISLLAGLIYMSAPYKICDIYSRNALGEYTAFIFIPMVFQGIYELLNGEKKGNYLLIIGASLLILSHTITTIYTALLSIIFIAYNFKKVKNTIFWKQIIIDILLILLLTAFYTIPIIEHKIYGDYTIFNQNMMNSSSIDVYNETNKITDWFSLETKTGLNYSFGLVITILLISTIFCFNKVDKKYKDIYVTFLVLAFLSLFMCTKLFPWLIMPSFLTIIQFAWRMNGFFIFFISLVCGINAYILGTTIIKAPKTITIVIIVMIFALAFFDTINYQTLSQYNYNKEKNYEKNMEKAESIGPFNINRDYMPAKACSNISYLEKRKNCTYILEGNAKISNEKKYQLTDSFEIDNIGSNDNEKSNTENKVVLELPFLYYHGYTTKINGKKVKNYESKNGFLCIETSENGKVEVNYTGTVIEKLSIAVSILTLSGIIIYFYNKNAKIQNKEK